MNPVTSEEIESILKLPESGKLRSIAEFVREERIARGRGKHEVSARWREAAQTIAAKVTREIAAEMVTDEVDLTASDRLRMVADALEGKHLPEPTETDQQRVLLAVNKFCAMHPGKLPSRRQLTEMGVRGEDITEVFANLEKLGTIRFPKEKRGRKPKN